MKHSEIIALAMKARQEASLVVDRHTNPSQKHASLALYAVLGSCMSLCERCQNSPAERKELEALFEQQPKTGNRRYVEKGSDIFVFVCRFVFTSTDRTNAIRYACALRQAHEKHIKSADLADWMKKNGGVNALYFSRPLDARQVKAKTLQLAEQITFSRDHPFTLTLSWRSDNRFEVIEQRQEGAEQ